MNQKLTTLATLFALAASTHAAVFVAYLDGASEASPNLSPATGTATVTYDPALSTLRVEVSFSGLVVGNTAAHIHATTATPNTGTAGVATSLPTFTGFPTGATSGSYDHLFDLTDAASWNPAFVTSNGGTLASAEAAFVAALAAQKAYLNIHTSTYPAGEIRGFFAVPEPGTYALIAGLGLVGFGVVRRSRRA